jgi:hypothetical protein
MRLLENDVPRLRRGWVSRACSHFSGGPEGPRFLAFESRPYGRAAKRGMLARIATNSGQTPGCSTPSNKIRLRCRHVILCGMTSDHFDRTLRAFQRRTPFRSFTVELMSGDRFQVDHPEALVVRDGAAVFIARRGVPTLFDHESVSQFIGDSRKKSA